MSEYQFKSYETVATQEGPFRVGDILDLSTSFYMGSRILSNIAFPNREIGEEGYNDLDEIDMQLQNLKKFSIKFYKILKAIKKADGPVFVYSNFKEYGGIKTLVKVLEFHGFKNYKKYGTGAKRFTVWSGDVKLCDKECMKNVFNQKKNKDGSLIKVILGSPAIKEGVSLLRVRQVHIMEPYWNFSRLEQVIGRAIRFCSHKDLPKKERKVEVFIYLATHPDDKYMIDKHILNIAKRKQKIIVEFERALKESAVDCNLFYHANTYDYDKKNRLICEK